MRDTVLILVRVLLTKHLILLSGPIHAAVDTVRRVIRAGSEGHLGHPLRKPSCGIVDVRRGSQLVKGANGYMDSDARSG